MFHLTAGARQLKAAQHLASGGIWGSYPHPLPWHRRRVSEQLGVAQGPGAQGELAGGLFGPPSKTTRHLARPQMSRGMWRESDLALTPESTISHKSVSLPPMKQDRCGNREAGDMEQPQAPAQDWRQMRGEPCWLIAQRAVSLGLCGRPEFGPGVRRVGVVWR